MTILETAIARAVENDELLLHYQPIVHTDSLEVAGYEALARWDRPGAGLLTAAEFIPVAEASDLICDVGVWVLNEALRQAMSWSGATGNLLIAVNFSGRHLNSPRISNDVATALRRHGVAPRGLVIEITETVLLDDLAVEHLHELRRLGIRLALDDLGTGHSSVSELSRLPVDIVKLDRSHLDLDAPEAPTRLRSVVEICHAQGLVVVGEGVEQPGQLARLRELEVELAQGFLLGRPMAAAELWPPEVLPTPLPDSQSPP